MDASSIKKIGIIGGGTAGYLTALTLLKRRPECTVTMIESPRIPVIGVGESSTPNLVNFLHHYLEIDVMDFYRAVKPTWKQGIKFEWGKPGNYSFNYDFTVSQPCSALKAFGDIKKKSLSSMLMVDDKSFMVSGSGNGKSCRIVTDSLNHAYHIDNEHLIGFLGKIAIDRGLIHVADTIRDIVKAPDKNEISYLVGEQKARYEFDLYIDCTGFSSRLIEGTLGVEFRSFSDSLFTDRALTFNRENARHIKPYTTVTTMQNGWVWNIPMREEDHLGYVYSSGFCDENGALQEVEEKYGKVGDPKQVFFRAGRHDVSWRGNVLAIGNAFAFVEPLESTGIHMIIASLKSVIEHFPSDVHDEKRINKINSIANDRWDSIRWFLSIHYKYNQKIKNGFWDACHHETNIGPADEVISYYLSEGPLLSANRTRGFDLSGLICPDIFRYNGYDIILAGQGLLPKSVIPDDISLEAAELIHVVPLWEKIVEKALPVYEALECLESGQCNVNELL